MPELRHDPIQKRWVIIATERGRRPNDYPRPEQEIPRAFCPFCEGNEGKTPPEIRAIRRDGSAPNSPGWKVRVVPNKFPALRIEGNLDRRGFGIFDRMNGVGAHEVIIETPRHDLGMADMPVEDLAGVIWMYRERLADLLRDFRFKYVLIFKNHGAAAGASLAHPHTQLIATPVTPLTLSEELISARDHYRYKERCIFCDVIEQELELGSRIVLANETFVAIAPYASRFPFELLLAPRAHHHSFAEIGDGMIHDLALMLKELLFRIKKCLNDPPYNFLIHTIPNVRTPPKRAGYWDTITVDFHWHIEIMPRLTSVAGFEWGTGFYINPTSPEEAAKYLREVEL
ncbi:MAG: galactose-1-phosphate uridylyltransferase [Acidobacteria bacterium]|nr:galactose-1-phosphate uridylyltransferase [Acidobacteriota bacterium]